jgi:hypothetical protein
MSGAEPEDDRIARWVEAEMADSFDEELEMELDDERLDRLLADEAEPALPGAMDRRSISASCSACRANWSNSRTGSRTTSSSWS